MAEFANNEGRPQCVLLHRHSYDAAYTVIPSTTSDRAAGLLLWRAGEVNHISQLRSGLARDAG
ncbi:MAG: hypothetical protein V3S70_10595 [Gammaproteobacteria bacterium]